MRMCMKLQDSMRLDPRPEFHRVILLRTTRDNAINAISTGGQRSSRIASLSGANGLVALPSKTPDGPDTIQAGQFVDAVVIGEIQSA